MAISPELLMFIQNWRVKAEAYSDEEIGDAFDRFFTLYVAFNRLYAEATFRLARRGQINLRNSFPDSKGAQEYVLHFCGARSLVQSWEGEIDTTAAIKQIAEHLRARRFALKLNIITGDRQPEADRDLLAALESRSQARRAHGVLEMLYAIRCNMFHGHKGFEPIQLELLRPAIILLNSTINVLYRALEEDPMP
jgi:hypothetical protein